MQTFLAIIIQIGLFFGPVLLFLVLKSYFADKCAGVVLALILAMLGGGIAFLMASKYGWQPRIKSGRTTTLSPLMLFWAFALGNLVILLLFNFVKPSGAGSHPLGQAAGGEATNRGWRVGHQGRDGMYYEEFRNGTWHRIAIDGEMLMGRAHHVIYFSSPEQWQKYPAWAAGRRDEIIARIKSEFTTPDYEYFGG